MAANWVADSQNAPEPPAYFLQRIFDYDSMLVLMPSRETAGAYVLARRKQFGPGITEAALDAVYTKADTKMCILHQTVPVCMVYHPANGSWSPDPLIRTLMARDTWAHGGSEKVADMLEAQEAAEKAKLRAEIRDDIYNRSGDAWRSYQARTGQSTIRFNDYLPTKGKLPTTGNTPDSPATGEVAAPLTTAGARSTAGSGDSSISFVGDNSTELSSIADSEPRLSVGAEPQVN